MPATTTDLTPLTVGDVVPDFTLSDQNGTQRSLGAAVAERPVLLVFYPFAFSGICTGELSEIRDDLGSFDNEHVQVWAVSCDPTYSLLAWADREGYFFPLLSDFWPHGQVADFLGVLHERGFAVRGTFLVDADRVIRWSLVNGPGERRDFAGFRDVVRELSGDSRPA